MYNALKINRGVINGFNFWRTNKIKRYSSQNDKSTNNWGKMEREQEMDKLLGIYKSNTKNADLPKFVPEVSDEELEDILLGRK